MTKQMGLWMIVCSIGLAWVAMPAPAQAQERYCQKLLQRKAFFKRKLRKYRRRYRTCRRSGWSYGDCRAFKVRYKRFRRRYRRARARYVRYNCSRYFQWAAPQWGAPVNNVPPAQPVNDGSYQQAKCQQLAARVQRWRVIRSRYRRRYRRCRRRFGRSDFRCRKIRRRTRMWYRKVNRARASYRAWHCHFTWNQWGGSAAPPTAPPTTSYQNARCRQLASRVQRWRSIRDSYRASWQRCRIRNGHYSPRCRSLRIRMKQWYRNVRSARANYRAWNCHFTWNQWNSPWSSAPAQPAHPANDPAYQQAKCQRLASRVQRWRSIRDRYRRSYRRCRRRYGRRDIHCRRIRRRTRKWYRKVNRARRNYRAWHCHFTWNTWSLD